MDQKPDLLDAIVRLESALDEGAFHYAVIGGVAVILQGYDRATRDLDAGVLEADDRLGELIAILDKHGLSLREPDGLAQAKRYRVILLSTSRGYGVDLSMGYPAI